MGCIEALARGFRNGAFDPLQIARHGLQCASRPQAQAIFAQLTPALARQQAGDARRRFKEGRPLGPLDGIPVTWKDVFNLAGTPTRCGSRLTSDAPAVHDAACVARLHAAGVVSLGKTNMSEFAFSGLGLNPHFGTAVQRAPGTGAQHIVGGSSSGAVAAVRLGIGSVALGTDTSGSIRVPAAYSGLVGFRPTSGRYPSAGVARLAPTMDTVGIIAATVADVVCVDSVLHGFDEPADAPPTTQLQFTWVENLCGDQVQPEVRANGLRLMKKLSDAGLHCDRQSVQLFDAVRRAFDRHGTLVAAEAAYELAPYAVASMEPRMDPFVWHRLVAARSMPAYQLVALLQIRKRLMIELSQFPPHTVYVFPTTPATAPALAQLRTLAQISVANSSALSHTMIGSFLDMPGITMPSGSDSAGMPTGILLSCRSGADKMLLSAAWSLEAMGLTAGGYIG